MLIIYSNIIDNYGEIISNGTTTRGNGYSSGGSTGGGSVNIFYKDNYQNNGSILAKKGDGAYGGGGSGGDGTVTIGNISTGIFIKNE